MPAVIRTELAAILPPIRTRLASVAALPAERVLLLQRESPPFDGHGDSYLWVRVEDGAFDMPNVIGAGRIDAREEVLFSVTARTRLAVDERNQDLQWLIHESLGNLRLRQKVIDAMLCFQPLDSSGNWLTTEPIKPARSRGPRKEQGKDKTNKEWGESTTYWMLRYEVSVTQTYQ